MLQIFRVSALCALIILGMTAALCAQDQAAPAKATKRSASNDKEAVDLLRRIEAKYAAIMTVSGQFRQVREDKTFGQKIEASANFHLLKPNKFRADYQPPMASTTLITDQYFYRYTPELKQVERYKFQNRTNVQDMNYMLLGFGVKTEDLLKVYSAKWLTDGVAKGHHGIQLVPLDAKSANFRYVTILVTNDERLLPAQFSMEQQDGSRTTANLNLSKLEIGGKIDESLFRGDFPRNAQVVDF